MSAFSRGLWIAVIALAAGLPLVGARIDPFVKSERDPSTLKFVREAYGVCDDAQRDAFGRCPTSHRSILRSRLLRGGGPGSGK